MEDSVLQFYEGLADEYHLIFADWQEQVTQQGAVLDRFIRRQLGEQGRSVLDCSCGIGTQAIGLAMRRYRVHATDLSPAAVERAKREAQSFGVTITVGSADVRALDTAVSDVFDVVLSCDNALPHLLTDADLSLAARQMKARLRTDGLLIVSIRDYDHIVRERERTSEGAVGLPGQQSDRLLQGRTSPTMPRVFDGAEGRRIVFQVWDWAADGRTYTLHHFIVKQSQGEWQTSHYTTEYRALLRDELSEILRAAGFSEICWHLPADSGYYQPIVTARNK